MMTVWIALYTSTLAVGPVPWSIVGNNALSSAECNYMYLDIHQSARLSPNLPGYL